ncbi:hypothetical protein [Bizionia saleffrena]|uniref:hypothetical protein n=1 Tax=Bizionia saleffrena TaxID=291189 RepID=UPI001478A028|nr:hypothetical protein [Bizionia saleffrena]
MSIDVMRKMEYNKVFKLFEKAKHIFLIDKSEIKNKEIIIREVYFSYVGEE